PRFPAAEREGSVLGGGRCHVVRGYARGRSGSFYFRVGGRHGEQCRQPQRRAGDDGRCALGAVLFEISRILNTGLDMETLSICVRLCEQGINPEALSSVIKELRKATEALKAAENMTS
uniref:Mitotic spindle organizing protein 1 n=1 Tax=Gallus gallus TaxID=9031 RepID=A0A8V0X6K4_CHICK